MSLLGKALTIFANRHKFFSLRRVSVLPAGLYSISPLISGLFSKPMQKQLAPPLAQLLDLFYVLDMLPISVTST